MYVCMHVSMYACVYNVYVCMCKLKPINRQTYAHKKYMHTYLHTDTYIHACTYAHMQTYTYIHMPKYIHMHKHIYTCIHTHIHTYIHTYMHTYIRLTFTFIHTKLQI